MQFFVLFVVELEGVFFAPKMNSEVNFLVKNVPYLFRQNSVAFYSKSCRIDWQHQRLLTQFFRELCLAVPLESPSHLVGNLVLSHIEVLVLCQQSYLDDELGNILSSCYLRLNARSGGGDALMYVEYVL